MNFFYCRCTFLFLFIINSALWSQTDSIPKHKTIKVFRPNDSTYIKAFTDFFVYYDNPGSALTYRDYVMFIHRYSSARNSERLKITDTRPKGNAALPFDYTFYFQNNHFTKDIKMRKQETDTVKLLVYVSNKGGVNYMDLAPMEVSGNRLRVYNMDRTEYKEDVVHLKTQNAFKELLNSKWEPAIIAALRTHPSKRKNKYKVTNAYSEGILTIIYSSYPILN